MKRSTAVRHMVEIAHECPELNDRLAGLGSSLRVTSVWAMGELLSPASQWTVDTQFVQAAIVINLPEEEVPWLGDPEDLRAASELMGWHKRPVRLLWRSKDAAVWNHLIVRPALLWDADSGPDPELVAGLREGRDVQKLRQDAPDSEELRRRLLRERECSLSSLRRATGAYESARWGRGRALGAADQLWGASMGLLNLEGALAGETVT